MTLEASLIQTLQNENVNLRSQIKYLEEQIAWFKRQIFGQKSEKIVKTLDTTPTLFDGLEDFKAVDTPTPAQTQVIESHERKKPNRNGQDAITLPSDIPVERQIIDVPADEKICKETGKPLVKIGEEVTRKLACKPGTYFVKEIIRPKYANPQLSEAGVLVAPLPESLLNRCQADESLLADIITKKFADHLPLYRQAEILARDGIKISRQILCQWIMRVGKALKPLYDEMMHKIVESGNIFIDETPINMLDPGKGKVHKAFMWVMVGGKERDPPYRIYDFYTNRKHANAEKLIEGQYNAVLHSDKYGAYEALANAKKIIWCPCWSHIRRKFFEAESGDPLFKQWVLRKIRHLFMLERVAWARSEKDRLQIRLEKEVPIINELICAIKHRVIEGKILPKSKFREALHYFLGLIPYLKNYTQYAYARLDNNIAERAVRPLAIGRKNWLFVGNEDGGEVAAILLSLIQTCRGLGINPREYLEDIMRRIMSHNAQKLDELLPDRWLASRMQAK